MTNFKIYILYFYMFICIHKIEKEVSNLRAKTCFLSTLKFECNQLTVIFFDV